MKQSSFLWGMLTLMMTFVLSGCGSDDSKSIDPPAAPQYYADLSYVPDQTDFVGYIEDVIKGDKSMSSLFNSNGEWTPYLKNSSGHWLGLGDVICIKDDNTILWYPPYLYKEGKGSGDVLYRFYAGSCIGNLVYRGEPTYYTYSKVDNKIYLSNGNIFTVTNDGLREDGSSTVLKKYDPTKLNRIASNDYWTTIDGEWTRYEYGTVLDKSNCAISKTIFQIGSNNKGKSYRYYFEEVSEEEINWDDEWYKIRDYYGHLNYKDHYYKAKLTETKDLTCEKDKSITDGNNYVIKVGSERYVVIYISESVLGLENSSHRIEGYTK